ncbi:hypothetical protein WA026_009126, partial [Henosepilachna vigintioctopunctata]
NTSKCHCESTVSAEKILKFQKSFNISKISHIKYSLTTICYGSPPVPDMKRKKLHVEPFKKTQELTKPKSQGKRNVSTPSKIKSSNNKTSKVVKDKVPVIKLGLKSIETNKYENLVKTVIDKTCTQSSWDELRNSTYSSSPSSRADKVSKKKSSRSVLKDRQLEHYDFKKMYPFIN